MACGTGAAEKPLCGDSSPEGPVNVEAKASPETETAAETFCKPLNLEPRTCYKRSPESSNPASPQSPHLAGAHAVRTWKVSESILMSTRHAYSSKVVIGRMMQVRIYVVSVDHMASPNLSLL